MWRVLREDSADGSFGGARRKFRGSCGGVRLWEIRGLPIDPMRETHERHGRRDARNNLEAHSLPPRDSRNLV